MDSNRTSSLTIQDAVIEDFTWDFKIPPRSLIKSNISHVTFGGFVFSGLKFQKGFLASINHSWDLIFYSNQINVYMSLPPRDLKNRYTILPSKLQLITAGEVKHTHPLTLKTSEDPSTPMIIWGDVWINKDGSWDDSIDQVRVTFTVSREISGRCLNTLQSEQSEKSVAEILKSTKPIDTTDYYLNDHLSDATLECHGITFPVHRFLLSCRSPLFREIFQAQKDPKKVVIIDDMEANILSILLKYIYSGQADLTLMSTELHLKLHKISEKYGQLPLQILCEQELVQTITKENCLEMLDAANAHGSNLLTERCVEVLKFNVREVLRDRTTFKTFCAKYSDLAHKFFNSFV